MKVTIYHNPKCGTSRNVLAMIRAAGIEPEIVPYLDRPLSRDALKTLFAATGQPVRDLLRRKETLYGELGLDDSTLTDAALIDAVARHPVLMNRPIVSTDLGTALCRPAETVARLLPDTGEYRPRRAWFERLVRAGPVTVKLNAIRAGDARIDADTFAAAAEATIGETADEIAGTDHRGAGFAILHEGEEGRWLLLHWWLGGGLATHILWRADLAPRSVFVRADPLLMACVWELGVIDFERRAWMRTAMSAKPVSDYIEDRFSGETV